MSADAGIGRLAQGARSSLDRRSLAGLAFWLTVSVAATLPFEFTKQWFPVTWIELSRLLMVAAILVSTYVAARHHEGLARDGLMVAAFLLVLTAAVSTAFHPSTTDLKALASSFVYLGFALTVAWNIRNVRDLWIFGLAVVGSAVVVALVAIVEQAFDTYLWRGDMIKLDRRNSTLGDPNIAARVLTLGLVTLLGLVLASRVLTRRELVGVALVAAVLGIGEALTQSRTMWVLTLLAIVAWIPAAALWRRVTFIPMAVFLVAMVTSIVALPFLSSRAATINPGDLIDEGSPLSPAAAMSIGPPTPADPLISMLPLDGVRRYLIRAGIAMWLDSPVTGVGLGGFGEAMSGPYQEYIPPDRRNATVVLIHTDAVRTLAESGLVGFVGWVVFVALCLVSVFRLLRRPGWSRAAGMVTLSAFGVILLASQLAGRFATEPYLWLLVGVLIAAPRIPAAAGRLTMDVRDGA